MSENSLSLPTRRSGGAGRGTSSRPRAGRTRFIVLGLLGIADGHEVITLQPSKPATLLATLLLHANSVVPVDFLLRVIWGEDSPATAKAALHTCVLRLRRLFGRYGIAGDAIEALPGGYRIAANAETLDLIHFRELLRRAHAAPRPEAELDLLHQALALWRTPVLSNVNSEGLHRYEVPQLTEEWLRAAERVFDIKLGQGRYREVLADIWPVAGAHPVHERFWEQLIEALYRSGRRAEALTAYRRVEEHLRHELGVGPGPVLRQLELAIVRGESLRTTSAAALIAGERGVSSATSFRRGQDPAHHRAEELDSGARVLETLLQAGLLERGPHGDYRMNGLLHALTHTAAGQHRTGPGPAGAAPPH